MDLIILIILRRRVGSQTQKLGERAGKKFAKAAFLFVQGADFAPTRLSLLEQMHICTVQHKNLHQELAEEPHF